MAPMKFGFGQALRRKEDDALLRGAGRYIADVTPAGTLHAVVLRSPHAHARFQFADLAEVRAHARRAAGADRRRHRGSRAHADAGRDSGSADIVVPPYPVLARDVVRHVGDAVAFVVADTLEQAQRRGGGDRRSTGSRCRMSIGAVAALKSGAPQVWPDRPGNLAFETAVGDAEGDAVRLSPRRRAPLRLTLVNQRLVTNYIDTRGVIAEYDGDRYTLTLGSQGSHVIRDILCGDVLKMPPDKMRVVTPDVGGGFGTKLFPYREYALAAVAAKRLRKPVKWVAERTEHFLGDSQGRDNITTAQAGARRQGPLPRARPRYCRRHGRLSVLLRAVHPVARRRHGAGRLRYPGRARAAARRLYQHRAGRCLSRRRAAGSGLS